MAKSSQANVIVPMPRWHRDVFVSAKRTTLTRRPEGRGWQLYRIDAGLPATNLDVTTGTLEGWQDEVAVPATQSTLISFGILAALAAPLAHDAGLLEGALFNFFGQSSSGKTMLARVAASVSGSPRDRALGHVTACDPGTCGRPPPLPADPRRHREGRR